MSDAPTAIRVEGLDATRELAARVARALRGGDTLGLIGPLGSGKTTFTKFLAAALGAGEPVSSPTFVLAHEYALPVDRILEHWDLYRLAGLPEELAEPPGGRVIRVVEWPDKIPSFQLTLELWIRLEAPEPLLENRIVTVSDLLEKRLGAGSV